MYEPKGHPPLRRSYFVRRLFAHLGYACLLVTGSLFVGMLGYEYLERLSWVDAFLNSAMLLGGMGPVDIPRTTAGKLFAGAYALYAGLVFVATSVILFTPILHRLLHKFHWSEKL